MACSSFIWYLIDLLSQHKKHSRNNPSFLGFLSFTVRAVDLDTSYD